MNAPATFPRAKHIDATLEQNAGASLFHWDRWTNQFTDQFNDVWVRAPSPTRKLWTVAFRDRGNVTRLISRHRSQEAALADGEAFIAGGRK